MTFGNVSIQFYITKSTLFTLIFDNTIAKFALFSLFRLLVLYQLFLFVQMFNWLIKPCLLLLQSHHWLKYDLNRVLKLMVKVLSLIYIQVVLHHVHRVFSPFRCAHLLSDSYYPWDFIAIFVFHTCISLFSLECYNLFRLKFKVVIFYNLLPFHFLVIFTWNE